MERFNTDPLKQLRNRILHTTPLRIVLGAGSVWYGHDFIATNLEELDVVDEQNWNFLFGNPIIDTVFAEHVWEHLDPVQAERANQNVYKFLRPGGTFRIAVPDGLHRDKSYIDYVKPGGTGAGADDHKILYNFVTLARSLKSVGFEIDYVEYWDGDGNFNHNGYDINHGLVQRSLMGDERNAGGQPNYTSLILDATKPDLKW
jgi:predicted SAM-dependent methyltransferase